MNRRTLLGAAPALIAAPALGGLAARPAGAQPAGAQPASTQPAWRPERGVTMICPFAAGGATDVMGRLAAGPMGQRLGQPVVVENVTGASGSIGAGRAARANADGHTILVGHVGIFAFNQHLFNRLPYDPLSDFAYIGEIGTNPMVLLVSRQSGIRSIAQLRERARSGRLTIGSSGLGTTLHMGGAMLVQTLGGQGDLIPYRGGAPAINDLLAGILDVVVDQAITAIPAIQGGALPLAVTGPQRLPQIAEVPTAQEAGLPGLTLQVWNILAAPRATPARTVQALAEALDFALEDATLKERFATYSAIAPQGAQRGPAAADALVRRESQAWGEFIRSARIERE
ncbi:Bug family tripartite tricarboxylate transporter substrate binding protein [Roseococcus sp. DSY-14]|uniref:Bug family tripartite tricarboxylate transporter substrate binding protein n=1 Tax=Roseococcus sp. DSY-14 TaxID=3369650 RepID=UPI00387B1780